jgi:BirA family biotin operon repressor/biotin-[acetyl-CoA-carboxylase] ligase
LLDGRKCAGILIEGEAIPGAGPQNSFIAIIGIGVNCSTHPSAADGIGFPATDLAAHRAAITPEQLLARLSATLWHRLAEWDRGRNFGVILRDWLAHVRGINEPIVVRNGDAEMQGRFVGVDQAGRLLLERPDGGLTKIAAGDVFPVAVRGPA